MNNLVIVHYAPIELYPPVQNLLRCIETKIKHENLSVISTQGALKGVSNFSLPLSKIKFYRIAKSGKRLSSLQRYLNYVFFYFSALFLLILKRPSGILYFETISCWPAYIYKRFINKNCQIFIHFHEYVSLNEYQNGTSLLKYFYNKEKWLLPIANWVSHTNEKRLQLFLSDIYPITLRRQHVVPNYPPKAWYRKAEKQIDSPLRIVYVGALSLSTMYTVEFANWVLAQNGRVHWDIYCLNFKDDAKDYIQRIGNGFISMKNGVEYDQLPNLLKQYQVGVVLYKGVSDNHIFSVSNKLFEYLVCGLDVWFPSTIKGSLSYRTNQTYPQVIDIDFHRLDLIDIQDMVDRSSKVLKEPSFFCESVLSNLIDEFTMSNEYDHNLS